MDITIQHPWLKRALGPFYPSRLFDQFFGEGLFEYDLLPFLSSTLSPYYRQSLFRTVLDSGISELMTRMWFVMHQPHTASPKNNPTKVRSDRDKFVVFLDVKHFSPEDLTVKVQEDFVEIHGKHNERQAWESICGFDPPAVQEALLYVGSVATTVVVSLSTPSPNPTQDDHGYISREFHRRYRLPSNVDQSALSCSLSADGMLTFSGPKVPSGMDAGHSERAVPVLREEKPSSASPS